MADLQPREIAEKNHSKIIEDAKQTVDAVRKFVSSSSRDTPLQESFEKEQDNFLVDTLEKLAFFGEYKSADIVRNGLKALNDIQARAFIIQNVLESVKSGSSLQDTLTRYHELGLTDFDPKLIPAAPAAPAPHAPAPPTKDGFFLMRLWRKLKKIAGLVMQLIVNACKTGALFVDVDPGIGIAAGFPMIEFHFKKKSAHLKEILETLTEGF